MTALPDSFDLRPRLTLMSEGQAAALHGAATSILEHTGLNVHHPRMRRLLVSSGARLGGDARVYLPPAMVAEALRTARREVVIHDRLGRPAMPLEPHRIYFGTGSDLLNTLDAQTGNRRPSTLADVARAARLCDALPDLDFVMSFALPAGVPNEDVEPGQYYALLSSTVKPVIMTAFSGSEALERVHAMACLAAGGERAFAERPNYILYGQFVSPLQHDAQAVERLIFCAEHQVPLIYIPTIMPGASGPVTLAGSLALAAAESLAGLVMHQACRPGAPFIFGACVSALDMRTMVFPYGSPEWRLSDLAMAELARTYGLPVFGTGGATDSKLVDAQAGSDYASSLLVAALAGTNLIHDVGYLESGRTGSLESIVLGADAIAWTRRFLAGLRVSPEDLALAAIAEVGPAGQFLDHDHTLRHFRQTVASSHALDREGYEAWQGNGAKDYAARARERALELLASHRPQPLGDALDAQLRAIAAPART